MTRPTRSWLENGCLLQISAIKPTDTLSANETVKLSIFFAIPLCQNGHTTLSPVLVIGSGSSATRIGREDRTRAARVVQESVYVSCAPLLAAVRDGLTADTSAADNLTTFAAAEAAYAAANSGRAERPQA